MDPNIKYDLKEFRHRLNVNPWFRVFQLLAMLSGIMLFQMAWLGLVGIEARRSETAEIPMWVGPTLGISILCFCSVAYFKGRQESRRELSGALRLLEKRLEDLEASSDSRPSE